jgi:hypothetical protein
MYHECANDFQIYAGDTMDNFADLCRIHKYTFENGLILNARKTQAMIICRSLPVLSLDGEVIPYSRNIESGHNYKNIYVFRVVIWLKLFAEMWTLY